MTENQKILNAVTKGIATNNSFIAAEYATKTELNNAVAAAFHYKGTVQNYAALANIQNPKAGDVYNITEAGGTDDNGTAIKAGDNVARTSDNKWDVLAGTTDLSGYVQTETGKALSTNDFTDSYKAKLEALDEDANENLTDYQINAAIAAANPDIKINFYGDTTKAVTMINGDADAVVGYTDLAAAALSSDCTKIALTAASVTDGYPEEYALNTAGTVATGTGSVKIITLNYTTNSVTVENA